MKEKSFDSIVTDPPWGVGIDYDGYKDTPEGVMEIIEEAVPEMLRIAHCVIIMPGTKYMHWYPRPTWTMAWVYSAGGAACSWGFTCWQPILCYGKDPYLANRMGAGRMSSPRSYRRSATRTVILPPTPSNSCSRSSKE